jgi:ACT domain-containing protein
MNAKELLQVSEQYLAFNTVMSGVLQDEIKACQEAMDALGGAQAISEAKGSLDADKASYESYKASVQAVFDQTKEELTAREQILKDQTITLASVELSLRADQATLIVVQSQLDADKETAAKFLADGQAIIAATQAHLADEQTQLDAAFAGITSREATVAAKLAAIQAAGA